MVVFDASILVFLLDPNASPPLDPATNNPVLRARDRVDFLVSSLEKSKTKIVIPTPALSEVLIFAGNAGQDYLMEMNTNSCFKIVDFDQRAAIEIAATIRSAIDKGDKRNGIQASWAKIKFDRQIISIAKVERATSIYSDDEDIKKLAPKSGIKVIGIAELPLPPEDEQKSLFDINQDE